MRKKKASTMKWSEAPDTIGVEDLMEILGVGKGQASLIFNQKNFPKIPGIESTLKADKEAVRLFLQGFKIKENPKNALDYMILLELKKLNNSLKGGEINDSSIK